MGDQVIAERCCGSVAPRRESMWTLRSAPRIVVDASLRAANLGRVRPRESSLRILLAERRGYIVFHWTVHSFNTFWAIGSSGMHASESIQNNVGFSIAEAVRSFEIPP